MDSALAQAELSRAVAGLDALPSPQELQELIARAELARFLGQEAPGPVFREVAWRLHTVAAAGADSYEDAQRAAAFRVSAHVFELALGTSRLREDQFRLCLGAAAGYRLGGLDPNAEALLRRVSLEDDPNEDSLWSPDMVLKAGLRLLTLKTRPSFAALKIYRSRLAALERDLGSLEGSAFWPAMAAVEGCIATLRWLVFGDYAGLESARKWFDKLAAGGSGASVTDRWAGVLLRSVCEELAEASIWRSLPEGVPASVRRALTMTTPSVLLLWPPQRDILAADDGPGLLDPDLRRAVLAVPTSAGKTLLASIMVLDHVARSGTSVAFVAPMRSLVSEVRGRLRPRLRAMDEEPDVGRSLPDFFIDALRDLLGPAAVDVFTPERLLSALRRDPTEVLAKYGLFVFDEAHHISDRERGFVLEQALSFLHAHTADTHHRIVLLSAALGNDAAVRAWFSHQVQDTRGWSRAWRGPRQVHAVFSADPLWNSESAPYLPTPRSAPRKTVPLTGRLRLSVIGLDSTVESSLSPFVGQLVLRQKRNGAWAKDTKASTSQAAQIAWISHAIEHGGPVLTVTGRRADAEAIARAVADLRENASANRILSDLAASRLGAMHPLSVVARRGVAFHHAGLPPEILAAVLEELEAGALAHVICTTTLTDGVNLPVHSVVVGEVDRGRDRWIRGPKLLNAIGRAGRAALETTGWVVLYAGFSSFNEAARLLRPSEAELAVRSVLVTDEALEALHAWLDRPDDAALAIFQDPPKTLRDFVSFVWWLLAADEQLESEDSSALRVLDATLGFNQANPADAGRWRSLAQAVERAYEGTDAEARQRWAAGGLSMHSSRRLDDLAESIKARVLSTNLRPNDLETALELFSAEAVLEQLVTLPEAPKVRWPGDVPLINVLRDWVAGVPLPVLAAEHFALVVDDAQEAIVAAAAQWFEYFLPWSIALLVDEANRRIEDENHLIFPTVSLHVRYGVDTAQAIRLAINGVRSRALIQALGSAAEAGGTSPDELVTWLADQGPAVWRDRFEASPTDVVDLLDFTRTSGTRTLQALLRGEEVVIELQDPPTPAPVAEVRSEAAGGLTIGPSDDPSIAYRVRTAQLADLLAVQRAGTPLSVRLTTEHAVVALDTDAFA